MLEPSSILLLNPGSKTFKVAVYQYQKGSYSKVLRFNEELKSELSILTVIEKIAFDFAVQAIGIRVVHAFRNYKTVTLWSEQLASDIEKAKTIAPIHNTILLEVINCLRKSSLKTLPLFACFDSSYFFDLPDFAKMVPVSEQLKENLLIERFGFHGFAHQSMNRQFVLLTQKKDVRVISLQLGGGCSITATKGGNPIETSMSYTPLDGLMMSSRCGAIDPGLILFWLKLGYTVTELENLLNYESGMKALTGYTDFRQIVQDSTEKCKFALEIFCQSILKYIGAYSVLLGGVDAILFGGGIGENSPLIRKMIVEKLAFWGVMLEDTLNHKKTLPLKISGASSPIDVYVFSPDEEQEMIRAIQSFFKGV